MFLRVVAAATILAAAQLPARSDPNWQDVLPAYYLIGSVTRNCKNITFTPDELAHVRRAIAFAEAKSGLAKAEADEIAKDMEESIRDNPEICPTISKNVHDSVKAMQAE